jgi:malonyl-CoA decarboxylase
VVFYSIINCEPGLRGVNLGNFLIKGVASELQLELLQLKTFCTLSPIPGLVKWLTGAQLSDDLNLAKPASRQGLHEAVALFRSLMSSDGSMQVKPSAAERLTAEQTQALMALASFYLTRISPEARGDSVVRFHLDNGARLERINPLANLSSAGLRQSAGLMVNYLYDLQRIEESHEAFVNGRVAHSKAVRSLI